MSVTIHISGLLVAFSLYIYTDVIITHHRTSPVETASPLHPDVLVQCNSIIGIVIYLYEHTEVSHYDTLILSKQHNNNQGLTHAHNDYIVKVAWFDDIKIFQN